MCRAATPRIKTLAADAEVDAVYVATPHGSHMENSLLCLEGGKAVLCEKPFAVNAAQAERMVREARERGLFLMEAMWTRYFPLMDRVRSLIDEGALGEVRRVHADFGYRTDVKPDSWLFDLHQGGGGLLDVGIYPVSLASMLLGRPESVVAAAHLGRGPGWTRRPRLFSLIPADGWRSAAPRCARKRPGKRPSWAPRPCCAF